MNLKQEISCWQQDIPNKEYLFALVKGVVLISLIAYLFYDSWLAVIGLLPILFLYFRSWGEESARKKEAIFRQQFKDSMQAMSAALNVGYSVENAFRETLRDLRPLYPENSRIMREFRQMIHQLDMNRTVEQVLDDFAQAVEQEDVYNFVTVFAAAKRMGGDSISLIQNAAKAIGEKIEIEREIQVMLAAKRLEFQIMCGIPFGIILYMRLSFSDFIQVLYGNLLGAGIMSACLLIYIGAYYLGKKIVEIEV